MSSWIIAIAEFNYYLNYIAKYFLLINEARTHLYTIPVSKVLS